MISRNLKLLACTLGVGALFALPTLAADSAAEITTAATHAGLAAKAADVDTVHKHLHHVLNCLEGPNGKDFDKAEANPCSKSGEGAIPDTMDAAKKKELESAVSKANAGLKATDLAAAQKDATAAADALKKIK